MQRRIFFNVRKDTPTPFKSAILENRNGKWVEVTVGGQVRSASGCYLFVRREGRISLCKVNAFRYGTLMGHIDLAQGHPVDYAGQIQFSRRAKRGSIIWWNNGSGHYKPAPEYAHQAGLPMEQFREGEFQSRPQPGVLVEEE